MLKDKIRVNYAQGLNAQGYDLGNAQGYNQGYDQGYDQLQGQVNDPQCLNA